MGPRVCRLRFDAGSHFWSLDNLRFDGDTGGKKLAGGNHAAPTSSRLFKADNLRLLSPFVRLPPKTLYLIRNFHLNMDTQRRAGSGKKPSSGAPKKFDPFWDLVVPSSREGKERRIPTTRAHPKYPQTNHAESQKSIETVDLTAEETSHTIARTTATSLHSDPGVMPTDTTFVKREAKGGLEPSMRASHSSIAEDLKHTQAQPVIRREKSSAKPTAIVQSARPYVTLGEMFKRIQATESVEHLDDGKLSATQHWGLTRASHKRDEEAEPSEAYDDTEGPDSDDDDVENARENDGGTASYTSYSTTQRSQLSRVTPQRANAGARGLQGKSPKEPSKSTVPKQKTTSSRAASVGWSRPRKRVKLMTKDSDGAEDEEEDEGEYEGEDEGEDEEEDDGEYDDEDEEEDDGEYDNEDDEGYDEEEGEGEQEFSGEDEEQDENAGEHKEKAAARTVRHNATHPAKASSQAQRSSVFPVRPPLSRSCKSWTKKEYETLFDLRRNQGKSWTYIGKVVLGRTAKAAVSRWDMLMKESAKPVEARMKGRRGRQISSLVARMAKMPKMPRMRKVWLEEEDELMIRLRTQGKSIKYIWSRIPWRGYEACKQHWLKIKDQYPEAVAACRLDTRIAPTSKLGQAAKEAESKSRPLERKEAKLRKRRRSSSTLY